MLTEEVSARLSSHSFRERSVPGAHMDIYSKFYSNILLLKQTLAKLQSESVFITGIRSLFDGALIFEISLSLIDLSEAAITLRIDLNLHSVKINSLSTGCIRCFYFSLRILQHNAKMRLIEFLFGYFFLK